MSPVLEILSPIVEKLSADVEMLSPIGEMLSLIWAILSPNLEISRTRRIPARWNSPGGVSHSGDTVSLFLYNFGRHLEENST